MKSRSLTVDKVWRAICITMFIVTMTAGSVFGLNWFIRSVLNAPTEFRNSREQVVAVEVDGKTYDQHNPKFGEMLKKTRNAYTHSVEYRAK